MPGLSCASRSQVKVTRARRAFDVEPPAVVSMGSGAALIRFHEGDEVGVLLVGQPDLEPGVVEVDQGIDSIRQPGMEVRRSRRQTAEDRRLELTDVGDLTGDQR